MSSVAHYKAKIKGIKQDLVDSRKAAAAELEDAIKRNQAEKQQHIQQLRDSQKSFEITTHNLEEEEEPHAAKYPILPNTANSESFATKTGPPAPAQFVSETNRSSPAPSQPCPSQSMAGSLPTSDTSTVSTFSVAHYREKLKVIKKKLVDNQKAAAAEIEDAIKRNQTDKQRYMQQLHDSQKGFDITTQNLETEQAIFQKQIKEKFETDIRQTKDAQHSKNKETTKELQKQQENLDAAKIAVELTVKQNQYEAAQTQEFSRIEQRKHKEEVQRVKDLLQEEREANQRKVIA